MEYRQEVIFQDLNTEPLGKNYMKRLKMMKMGNSKKTCSICIECFGKGQIIYKLPCGHIFHTECLVPWFDKKHQCPYCKNDIRKHFDDEDQEVI